MRTGGGGQYDMVSASGDASLRLIYGKDVQPVERRTCPGLEELLQRRSSRRRTTPSSGQHYGISLQWGPNTLLYNTKKVKPAPTSWGAIYSSKYKGKRHGSGQPDPDRRRGALPSKTKPSLGIKDPYELNQTQFDAAIDAAQEAEAADQEVLGARLRRDRPVQERRRFDRRLLAVPDEHAAGRQGAGEGHDPEGGRDGLARHVDALRRRRSIRTAPTSGSVDLEPEGAGSAGGLLTARRPSTSSRARR